MPRWHPSDILRSGLDSALRPVECEIESAAREEVAMIRVDLTPHHRNREQITTNLAQ